MALLPFVDKTSYNPNTVALVYLTIGIYITLIFEPKLRVFQLLNLLLIVFGEYMIWITESRTCFIAFLVYFILRYFSSFILKNKYLLFVLVFILTAGSLVYVKIYVEMAQTGYSPELLEILVLDSPGKGLFSGRESIWYECLELFNRNPWFGTGSKINLQSFDSVNLHNSFLDFFVVYGFVVGSLIIYLIIKIIMDIHSYMYDPKIRKCTIAFFTFLIVAYSETNIAVMPFMSFLCLMMAYSRKRVLDAISDHRIQLAK